MRVQAALGWLELGNPHEARAELGEISPENAHHPWVLEVCWQVARALADWESALSIAREQIQTLPTEPAGYIHQAYALRRLKGGGLEKAHHALLPAARLFPEDELVHYNLACYTAQLGRLDEAWHWLSRALNVSQDSLRITQMALNEDDLRPLWAKIKALHQPPGT